jgi:phenol 2-monooxygenase
MAMQLGEYLSSREGPIRSFTPSSKNVDSLIETIVVGHGKRQDVELEQIPECFYPATGQNQTRGQSMYRADLSAY